MLGLVLILMGLWVFFIGCSMRRGIDLKELKKSALDSTACCLGQLVWDLIKERKRK